MTLPDGTAKLPTMSWWVVVAATVVGFASGILSGMFGVGGAVLTTPGIRALGATPIEAVGSTVPAILPGSISGAIRYAREGLVEWRIGLVCGGAGVVFAFLGAEVADRTNARVLMVLTAMLLLWSGVNTIRGARAASPPDPEELAGEADEPGPPHEDEPVEPATPGPSAVAASSAPLGQLLAIGTGAGFLAGLLGVGGGVVMVPAFTAFLGLPIKRAVGTSLVAVAMAAAASLLTHWARGNIDWAFALPLMVGVVPGARLGSKVAIAASDRTIRLAFGIFLVVLAVGYGGSELVSLVS